MTRRRPLMSWPYFVGACVLAGLAMAPTPGDIGGCGQQPQQLDARTFFGSKKIIDCRQCTSCGLHTEPCQRACDRKIAPDDAFPDQCYPLVHDGEVCLRALYNASCDDYASFVADSPTVRTTPTECNFCPPR